MNNLIGNQLLKAVIAKEAPLEVLCDWIIEQLEEFFYVQLYDNGLIPNLHYIYLENVPGSLSCKIVRMIPNGCSCDNITIKRESNVLKGFIVRYKFFG